MCWPISELRTRQGSSRDPATRKDQDFRRSSHSPNSLPPSLSLSLSLSSPLLLLVSSPRRSLSFFPRAPSSRGPPPTLRTGAGVGPRCSESAFRREAAVIRGDRYLDARYWIRDPRRSRPPPAGRDSRASEGAHGAWDSRAEIAAGTPDVENHLGVSATYDPSPTRGRHAPQRDATRCNAQGPERRERERSRRARQLAESPRSGPEGWRGGALGHRGRTGNRPIARACAHRLAQPANPYRRKNVLPRARHSRVRACVRLRRKALPQSSRLSPARGSSSGRRGRGDLNLKRAIVAPAIRLEICRRARSIRVHARDIDDLDRIGLMPRTSRRISKSPGGLGGRVGKANLGEFHAIESCDTRVVATRGPLSVAHERESNVGHDFALSIRWPIVVRAAFPPCGERQRAIAVALIRAHFGMRWRAREIPPRSQSESLAAPCARIRPLVGPRH